MSDHPVSSRFFAHIRTPASFTVQLHPQGATHLVNGRSVPIRLHTCIQQALDREGLNQNGADAHRYAIVVEKQSVSTSSSQLSRAYDAAMEKMNMQEAAYMMEISIEEITVSTRGEDVFGKRAALFTTTLRQPEENIAAEIVRIIREDME